MSLEILGFSTNLIDCQGTLSDKCCGISPTLGVLPWAYRIDGHTDRECPFLLQRRTEKGWTLDFMFDKEDKPWNQGGPFYFWGVREEDNEQLYADNNLSFRFTNDGRIEWRAYRYSGSCINEAYKEDFYISSGQTPVLCTDGTSEDFNITIVFDRHLRLTDCNIPNDGGWNDMILGETITNAQDTILSGSTETFQYNEVLTKDWNDERYARLGTLKIYLNGWPIYKLEDWEEVIPSYRGQQPFIQSWGGGASGSGGIHEGDMNFKLKRVKYFETPMNALQVRDHYLTLSKPYFDIVECVERCEEDEIEPYHENTILLEQDINEDGILNNEDAVYTEGGDIIIF
jgi:hypothetical protein